MKELHSLLCGTTMKYMGKEKIQLGQTGWLFGDLSNLFAGALEVTVFRCPVCGKLEFFSADEDGKEPVWWQKDMPRQICPECAAEHDTGCYCCPVCGHQYEK